jgi:hypothetical protein
MAALMSASLLKDLFFLGAIRFCAINSFAGG